MTRNPLLNALSALLYIIIVASIVYFNPKIEGKVESVIVPITFLSLFVLPASVMGYIFCLEPIKQYADGNKKEAVELFAKTIGYFALITLTLFCLLVWASKTPVFNMV